MCLEAARNAAPNIANCVDTLAACTGADTWTRSKQDKMKLSAILAYSHQKEPNISPAYVWSKNTNLVPLTDPVFDPVVAFLQSFPTL